MLGGLDMIPSTKSGSQAINAYPVHRPYSLTVAGTDLSGVVAAIVITVVLGRASRAKKLALGKDGLTNVIIGRVRPRAQPHHPVNQATAAL
jgi:hypothetical protein